MCFLYHTFNNHTIEHWSANEYPHVWRMEAIFHCYRITRLVHVASSTRIVSKKRRISNNIIALLGMQKNGYLWHAVYHELLYQEVVHRVIWLLNWNVPWGTVSKFFHNCTKLDLSITKTHMCAQARMQRMQRIHVNIFSIIHGLENE